MSTIAERVARGVAWLDENRPAWDREIDLNQLVLSSPCRCILGQLYGDYQDAPVPAVEEERDHEFGFTLDVSTLPNFFRARDAAWTELEAEWRRVITERRAAA